MDITQKILPIIKNEGSNFIIGVSGGVDSIVLLDVLAKQKDLNVSVCHVNYNLREDSDKDEKVVRDYCKEKNIPFYNKRVVEKITGNIQGQARLIRYKFFQSIAKKINVKKILIAHHADDHIETYLLQTKRNILVEHYGLKQKRKVGSLSIIRPMLDINKSSIKLYAQINNLNWFEDSSNKENKYLRNKIRNEFLENSSAWKKSFLLKKIEWKNKRQHKLFKKAFNLKDKYISDNKIDATLFEENQKSIQILLYWYLKENKYPVSRINKNIIAEIQNFHTKTVQTQAKFDLVKEFKWKKDYNKYYVLKGDK